MPVAQLLDDCAPQQGVIRDYLRWVVETTHAPQLFHLGAIVPAVCFEAARRGLTIGRGGSHFRLLCCLIAGPGSAKSTAKRRAQTFIEEWYGRTTAIGLPVKPYVSLKGSTAGILDRITALKEVTGPAAGTTPVIFDADEVSIAFKKDDVEELLNELYDGHDYERHLVRLQKDNLANAVKRPRINGVFCGTPSSLEHSVREAQVSGGLFSRFLFIRQKLEESDLRFEEQSWPEGRTWAMENWTTWKRQLDVLFDVQGVSRRVLLSPEAESFLQAELWPLAKHNIVRETRNAAAMARLTQHAEVVGAVYAITEAWVGAPHVSGSQIWVTREQMERAIRFVSFCVKATNQLADVLGTDPVSKLVERTVHALQPCGEAGMIRSSLWRRTGKPPKAMMDQALATLIDNRIVMMQVGNTSEKGGRPPIIYILVDSVNDEVETVH